MLPDRSPSSFFGGLGRFNIDCTLGISTPAASALAGRAWQDGHSSDPDGTNAPHKGHSTSSNIICGGLKHIAVLSCCFYKKLITILAAKEVSGEG